LKTHTVIQPVFFGDKIQRELKVHEINPPIVNQQRVIYKLQCDLCDASYVGFLLRHLHQGVAEHIKQSSSIGKHFVNEQYCSERPVETFFRHQEVHEYVRLFSARNVAD